MVPNIFELFYGGKNIIFQWPMPFNKRLIKPICNQNISALMKQVLFRNQTPGKANKHLFCSSYALCIFNRIGLFWIQNFFTTAARK